MVCLAALVGLLLSLVTVLAAGEFLAAVDARSAHANGDDRRPASAALIDHTTVRDPPVWGYAYGGAVTPDAVHPWSHGAAARSSGPTPLGAITYDNPTGFVHVAQPMGVYEETPRGLVWRSDADKYGDFIVGKHNSDVGTFIPWKDLR